MKVIVQTQGYTLQLTHEVQRYGGYYIFQQMSPIMIFKLENKF